MTQDINVKIWENMFSQGVDPKHVLDHAGNHEGWLDALPISGERDEAIRQTVAFIKKVQQIIENGR